MEEPFGGSCHLGPMGIGLLEKLKIRRLSGTMGGYHRIYILGNGQGFSLDSNGVSNKQVIHICLSRL